MYIKSSSKKSNLNGSYSSIARLAKKSAIALSFIDFWLTYVMSYSDNRIYHRAILPESAGDSIKYFNGSSFEINHVV